MSVPLDRLYDFLQDITCRNEHVVIYRFHPHGSRKISDLTQSRPITDMKNKTEVGSKFVFFYDQEPLNFDHYTSPTMFDEILQSNTIGKKLKQILNIDLIQQCQDFLASVASQLNIRVVGIEHGLWFKPVILVHSELRSSQLQRYQEQDFIGVYWWSHALIARDWFRYAQHDPALELSLPKTCDFLIYNRAWSGTREYRLKFVELLAQHDVLENCLTWFNPVDQDLSYHEHKFSNPNFQITNYQLHQLIGPGTAD